MNSIAVNIQFPINVRWLSKDALSRSWNRIISVPCNNQLSRNKIGSIVDIKIEIRFMSHEAIFNL